MWDCIDLYCLVPNAGPGKIAVPSRPMEFETIDDSTFMFHEENGRPRTYTGLSMDDKAAQTLLDSLYNLGFRPINTIDRTETVEALKEHIRDLNRELAFLRDLVLKLSEPDLSPA